MKRLMAAKLNDTNYTKGARRGKMVGDMMRDAREQLRMTQNELKEALNARLGRAYDKSRVSRWENGREAIPNDVACEIEVLLQQRNANARACRGPSMKKRPAPSTS